MLLSTWRQATRMCLLRTVTIRRVAPARLQWHAPSQHNYSPICCEVSFPNRCSSGTHTSTSSPTTSSHIVPPKIEGSRNAHDQPASFLESGDPWAARRRENTNIAGGDATPHGAKMKGLSESAADNPGCGLLVVVYVVDAPAQRSAVFFDF